jgi:pimeloyl-ACP methyl ester carboxylesterase
LRGAIDIGGQRENVLDHAHRIKALPPITIYWGDDDPVIPAKHAEIASQIFEGVQVRSFKNVGHYPHREVAGEVMPSLLRFLDEPQPTPRIRRKSPGIASAPRRFWQLVGAR